MKIFFINSQKNIVKEKKFHEKVLIEKKQCEKKGKIFRFFSNENFHISFIQFNSIYSSKHVLVTHVSLCVCVFGKMKTSIIRSNVNFFLSFVYMCEPHCCCLLFFFLQALVHFIHLLLFFFVISRWPFMKLWIHHHFFRLLLIDFNCCHRKHHCELLQIIFLHPRAHMLDN